MAAALKFVGWDCQFVSGEGTQRQPGCLDLSRYDALVVAEGGMIICAGPGLRVVGFELKALHKQIV